MDKNYEKLRYWLGLLRVPEIGPSTFHKLLEQFPNLEEFFKLSSVQGQALGFHGQLEIDQKGVDKDLAWLDSKENHHIICIDEPEYPFQLKQIVSAPPVLFIKGDVQLISKRQIAIVGSRNPTPFGIENAHYFARELAKAGWVITSGLALGIDAAAHRGVLSAKNKTIAVMATGLDRVYPASHVALLEEILEYTGAIVSEFPINTPPLAQYFPRRNRIISGLAKGVLVIEATINSGSLITAHLANEQGREVYAVPGSIHNPLAKGCHQLIKQGAKLVEKIHDIIEELPSEISPFDARESAVKQTRLAESHQKLLECVDASPVVLDLLMERSALNMTQILPLLLDLELRGYIEKTSEGYLRVKL